MRQVLNFPAVEAGRNLYFKYQGNTSASWNPSTDNVTLSTRLRSLIGGTASEAIFADDDFALVGSAYTGRKNLDLTGSVASIGISTIKVVQNHAMQVSFNATPQNQFFAFRNATTGDMTPFFRLSQFANDAALNTWLTTNIATIYTGRTVTVSGNALTGTTTRTGAKVITFDGLILVAPMVLVSGQAERFVVTNGDGATNYQWNGSTARVLGQTAATMQTDQQARPGRSGAIVEGSSTAPAVTNEVQSLNAPGVDAVVLTAQPGGIQVTINSTDDVPTKQLKMAQNRGVPNGDIIVADSSTAPVAGGAYYDVSGAGDTTYNGRYTESGSYNGSTQYKNANNRYLYIYSGSYWFLGTAAHETGSSAPYYANGSASGPPQNGWYTNSSGTSPAPTLSALGSSTGTSGSTSFQANFSGNSVTGQNVAQMTTSTAGVTINTPTQGGTSGGTADFTSYLPVSTAPASPTATGTGAVTQVTILAGSTPSSVTSTTTVQGGDSEVSFVIATSIFGGSQMRQGMEMNSANQIILVPEDVPGTYKSSATPIICNDWKPSYNSNDTFDSFRAAGRNADQWNAKVYGESQFNGEWRPSYTCIDTWLLGLCGYPVVDSAPSGIDPSGIRHREYVLPDKGRRSILTYTLDWGEIEKVVRCPYGIISALTLSSEPTQGTRGNISMLARDALGVGLPMSGTTNLLAGRTADASSTVTNPANLLDLDASTSSSFSNNQQLVVGLVSAQAINHAVIYVKTPQADGVMKIYGGATAAGTNKLLGVLNLDGSGILRCDIGDTGTYSFLKFVVTSAAAVVINGISMISEVNGLEFDSLPVLSNHWAVFRSLTRAGLYSGGVPNTAAFMPTCDMFDLNFANLVNPYRSHDRSRTFREHVDSENIDITGNLRLPVDETGDSVDMLLRAQSYLSGPSWFLMEAICPLAPYRFAIEWLASVKQNVAYEANNNVYERRFPLSRIAAPVGQNSLKFITEVAVPTA